MQNKFSWYFRATDDEINKAWKGGVLTVDANFLLDLYRYHESTRNSLISSLQKFEGKLWLSYQACEEFFRNRTRVILSSEKTFKQAKEEVEKLRVNIESSVAQLRGNRIIPAEIASGLISAISPAISQAQEQILQATSSYPNFLKDDPILNQLSNLFSGAVGNGFKAEEISEIIKVAEDRKQKKIPPGYLDDDKDGDRAYGDYFLWRQIIEHAKTANVPIIFVTSERKEDWWEKISNRTTGPRPELLKEAHELAGQKILIYQTDRFLEYALKRHGGAVDTNAVEEIRAVSTLRSETESAVKLIEHKTVIGTEMENEGILTLSLKRPVKNFTGSGHLEPHMTCAPNLSVRLLDCPEDTPPFKLSAGTGTTYDFNIHIRAVTPNIPLPTGQYTFTYEACCQNVSENSNFTSDEGKI